MSDITYLLQLVAGVQRNVSLSSNTIVVSSIKIGASALEIKEAAGHFDFSAKNLTNVGTVDGRDVSADGSALDSHIANTSNPHSTTKSQVGLGNVDNVQQLPMSYLDTDNTLAADSDLKVASQKAIKFYVDNAVSGGTGAVISDTAFGVSWNGVTGVAPSKNAVYDEMILKANDNIVIKKDGSVAFTANQAMGGFQLTGLVTPTADDHAARKKYVDDQDALKVSKAGDSMTGNLAMGGNKVTGLAAASAAGEAVRYEQLQNALSLIQNFQWQPSVKDRDLSTPPGSPSIGDRYIVKATGTGAWASHDNEIAEWDGSAWVFTSPTVGSFTSANDEPTLLLLWSGSAWDAKYFESTTASNGLTKVGFDIQLDSSAAGAALGFSAGVLSVKHDGQGLDIVSDELSLELDGLTLSKSASGLKVAAGGITNTEVSASAAIAYSKLALSNSIVNADIAAAAAIAYSKLNLASSIVNADVSASAAIAYSKLNLASSIVNADISASAAIAYSKLNLASSIVNADVAAGAAIAESKLALDYSTSSLNTAIDGKANKALDNLASVAINASLLPAVASTKTLDLGADSAQWANLFLGHASLAKIVADAPYDATFNNGFAIRSKDQTDTTSTSNLFMRSGNTVGGISGRVIIRTGNAGAGTSGDLLLTTGSATTRGKVMLAGNSVEFQSDAAPSADNARKMGSAAANFSEVHSRALKSNNALAIEASGNISINANSGGGDVNVSAHILPSSDNNYNLGSTSFRFASISALQVAAGASQLVLDGSSISVNSKQVKNVADPTADQDAATKIYVDPRSTVVTVTAGESFAANTCFAVRWGMDSLTETADRVYKADKDASSADKFYVFGISIDQGAKSAGDSMQVRLLGSLTIGSGNSAFAAADVGKPVFLSSSGAFTMTAPSASGEAVVRAGIVQSTSKISVQPAVVGVN